MQTEVNICARWENINTHLSILLKSILQIHIHKVIFKTKEIFLSDI
jgi:hypothetical protein